MKMRRLSTAHTTKTRTFQANEDLQFLPTELPAAEAETEAPVVPVVAETAAPAIEVPTVTEAPTVQDKEQVQQPVTSVDQANACGLNSDPSIRRMPACHFTKAVTTKMKRVFMMILL